MNPTREHLPGLELAKEHLDSITNWGGADSLSKLITQAQAATPAEPVAWIITDINGDSYFAYDRQTPSDTPLYAHPPAPDAELIELLRIAWNHMPSPESPDLDPQHVEELVAWHMRASATLSNV